MTSAAYGPRNSCMCGQWGCPRCDLHDGEYPLGRMRNDISPFAHTAREQTYYGRMALHMRLLFAVNGTACLEQFENSNGALVVRWIESETK